MRKATIFLGVGATVIGVGVGLFWLITAGIGLLIVASLLPQPESADGPYEAMGFGWWQKLSALPSWLIAGLCGSGLILLTFIGVWRSFDSLWPLISWGLGMGLLTLAAFRLDADHGVSYGRLQLTRQAFLTPDMLLLGLLTLIALFLRTRQLDSLPPMHGDEGEMGMLALQLLSPNGALPPFSTGFLDHPTLFHYAQAGSMLIFGRTVFGLRMVSAIFGTLCVPAVYALGRIGWGRTVGLTAAGMLAFSHIHIQISRLGLNNVHSVLMGILLMLLVLWADGLGSNESNEEGRPVFAPWLLVGLTAGLAQYFYYGSRLFPVLLIPILILVWLRGRAKIKQLSLVGLGFLAAWLPLTPRFIKIPATFFARQSGVNIFLDQNMRNALGESATNWDIFFHQAERNLRFFIDSGDISSFYFNDAPGLNAVAAVLFWIGLGLVLLRLRRFSNAAIFCWFLLGLGLGGILTNTSPAATRLVIVYPAVGLMCGIAVETALSFFGESIRERPWVEYGLIVILLGLMGQAGVSTYFGNYAVDPPQAHMAAVGRAFADQPANSDLYLLGAPILFAQHGTVRFYLHPRQAQNLSSAAELETLERASNNLFVIALPPQEENLNLLMEQHPGGELQLVNGATGRLLFFTYRVEQLVSVPDA